MTTRGIALTMTGSRVLKSARVDFLRHWAELRKLGAAIMAEIAVLSDGYLGSAEGERILA